MSPVLKPLVGNRSANRLSMRLMSSVRIRLPRTSVDLSIGTPVIHVRKCRGLRRCRQRPSRHTCFSLLQMPMRRDLSQPVDPGVLKGDVRVEALGDGGVMMAVRCSRSSSISRCFFATSASSLAVSRSRKAAIARCSVPGGTGQFKLTAIGPCGSLSYREQPPPRPPPECPCRRLRTPKP